MLKRALSGSILIKSYCKSNSIAYIFQKEKKANQLSASSRFKDLIQSVDSFESDTSREFTVSVIFPVNINNLHEKKNGLVIGCKTQFVLQVQSILALTD